MSATEDTLDHPGRLARIMAELPRRLRHSVVNTGRGLPAVGSLASSAALLPELASYSHSFIDLGRAVDRLLAELEARPEWVTDYLVTALGALSEFFDELLAAVDEGSPHPLELTGWEHQIALWNVAGTPDEVFAEFDLVLRRWRRRWPDAGPPTGLVVVLMEGRQRRDRIMARLEQAGVEPIAASDAAEATALAREPGAVAIAADDVEPGRYLSRLAGRQKGNSCPLVLISCGQRDRKRESLRARRLGAVDAWCEPWDPDEMTRILQRLSHP